MGVMQLGGYNTISSSTSVTVDPTVGNLQSEVVASWADVETGGAAGLDGFPIPMIYDRSNWFEATGLGGIVPVIASASEQPHLYKSRRVFDLIMTTEVYTYFRKNQKLSIGSLGAAPGFNHTYIGAFDVHDVMPPNPPNPTAITIVANPYYDNPPIVTAASMVGENIYSIHQWGALVDLGILKVNLGVGYSLAGQGTIRAALVFTGTPTGAKTYSERFVAGEVIWSSFYPVLSQFTIDFSGIQVPQNGYYPFENAAPNMGRQAEKRLMLCFYWETTSSGTPAGSLPIDIDLTYKTETTIEQNAVRKI